MRQTLSARRLGFAFALVAVAVGVGLYLVVALPARAQVIGSPGEGENGGFVPGFEGFIPPPMEFAQGMVMLNDQYVYVMMGRTLYQFRHAEFPGGMKKFAFKPEGPLPPSPMPAPGFMPAPAGGR